MPNILIEVSKDEKDILTQQKEKLNLTWRDALIRGLAMGYTPAEDLGLPDPIKDATVAAMQDNEFLEQLDDINE